MKFGVIFLDFYVAKLAIYHQMENTKAIFFYVYRGYGYKNVRCRYTTSATAREAPRAPRV